MTMGAHGDPIWYILPIKSKTVACRGVLSFQSAWLFKARGNGSVPGCSQSEVI